MTGEARELPSLQPQWGWRFFAVAAGLWLFTMATQRAAAPLQERRRPEPQPEPAPGRPEPVSRLFDDEHDPLMVIKWKETLDFLEDATDRCEDVANVLEGVVVKNG